MIEFSTARSKSARRPNWRGAPRQRPAAQGRGGGIGQISPPENFRHFLSGKRCSCYVLFIALLHPKNPHGQALEEVRPRQGVPARRRTRPRLAPRVGRAAAANPGAADARAHGRAYRAPREPHGSPRSPDHRGDAGKARAISTDFIRANTDRRRRPDEGRRSSGDGPNARADGRTRPLSRLRAAAGSPPGRDGVASPRNVAAACDAVGAGRSGREIFLLTRH